MKLPRFLFVGLIFSVGSMLPCATRGQSTATTDPVGFQGGFSFFKLVVGADNRISDAVLTNSLSIQYGVFDGDNSSFTPYWPNFYNTPPFVTPEEPYKVTYEATGYLVFAMHRYHPAIWQQPWGSSELLPWFDPPSGTQKLGLEFTYIDNAEELRAVIVLSTNSTNFIDALSDYAVVGSMAPDPTNDGVSIALVPEPSTYALLLLSGVGALLWAKRRRC
jgi:hypothetical protein